MSSRLYVGNLSYDTDTETLRQAFAGSGEVTDAHVVTDRESGRSRGFGFVTMASPEMAQKAIQEMNGAMIDGRSIRVNEAEERPRGGGGGGFGGGGGGRGGGGGGGFGGGGGGGGFGGGGGGRNGGGGFGGGGRGGGGGGGGRGGGRGGPRGR
jgi:RNA recognition motif-containing protein